MRSSFTKRTLCVVKRRGSSLVVKISVSELLERTVDETLPSRNGRISEFCRPSSFDLHEAIADDKPLTHSITPAQ